MNGNVSPGGEHEIVPLSVHEVVGRCAVCGGEQAKIREVIHEVSLFGRISITSCKCNECGYHVNDIHCIEQREPLRFKFSVERPEDLSVKIVRSRTGVVSIPEIGTSMEPGPCAPAFITNVEGILARFEDAANTLMEWAESEEDRRKCREIVERIRLAREGNSKFTIIVEDPYGNSAIIADGARLCVEKLTEDEVERLILRSEEY